MDGISLRGPVLDDPRCVAGVGPTKAHIRIQAIDDPAVWLEVTITTGTFMKLLDVLALVEQRNGDRSGVTVHELLLAYSPGTTLGRSG